MTRILLIAILPLTIAGPALARDCGSKTQTSASICMPGAVWDADKALCITQPGS